MDRSTVNYGDRTSPRRTGFLYDAFMEKHECPWDPMHIETPARMTTILQRLQEVPGSPLHECIQLRARFASEDEIRLVHEQPLIDTVKQISKQQSVPDYLPYKEFSSLFNSVYLNEWSEKCALMAAGSSIDMVEEIHCGRINNGMAIVRPPGHHAFPAESNGFCVYNNAAIAAQHLLQECLLQRILIVDFDVHHGQGTQRTFYEDNRVLYFSIHVYEDGGAWPFLRESDFDHIGEGRGRGFNVNIPLNRRGLGDAEYMAIFHRILMPIAFEYNPEFVIVSAGYDAAIGCPEGHMMVTPAMYGHMTHMLMSLAGGKVAVVLEGGYCLDSLAEGVVCTLEALLGKPPQPLPSLGAADETVVSSILAAISCLRKYWDCLKFQDQPRETQKLPFYQPEVEYSPPDWLPHPNEAYIDLNPYSAAERVALRDEINALKLRYDKFRESLPTQTRYCDGSNLFELCLWDVPNRTCFVYDEMMCDHVENGPEVPARITVIYDHLQKLGLLERCLRVPSRDATSEELLLVHDSEYVYLLQGEPAEFAAETSHRKQKRTPARSRWSDDIWASEGTQPAVFRAAGSLLNVVDCVMSGKALNGFAIIRPPGHHAHPNHPAGFCFGNNVAVAAAYILKNRGVERVLIVDWDVHHGDGIQKMFYDDPRVLYVSIHRGGDFYPGGEGTGVKFTGRGKGQGHNINIPWKTKGKGDGDYLAAFLQLVMPVAYEFAPELVLVSCGFDAALGDPLGECAVTPFGYSLMTRMLMSLAGGRLVLAQEGGYNLTALAKSAEAIFRALMGYDVEKLPRALIPSSSAVDDINHAIDAHIGLHQVWNTLQYRVHVGDLKNEAKILSPVSGNLSGKPAGPSENWEHELSNLADTVKKINLE